MSSLPQSALDLVSSINARLPSERHIDAGYISGAAARGHSEQLLKLMVLDRLEARLRSLDTNVNGETRRRWEDSWAADVLAADGPFEAFRETYIDNAAEVMQPSTVAVREAQRAARKMLVMPPCVLLCSEREGGEM